MLCGFISVSPSVSAKTHLLVGLGIRAVEQGFSVQYFRFDELMTALKADAALPPSRLKRRKYMSTALLLIAGLAASLTRVSSTVWRCAGSIAARASMLPGRRRTWRATSEVGSSMAAVTPRTYQSGTGA